MAAQPATLQPQVVIDALVKQYDNLRALRRRQLLRESRRVGGADGAFGLRQDHAD